MFKHPGRLALLIAVLPTTGWTQQCVKPELPHTEFNGWRVSEAGHPVAGTARYLIASPDSGPNETFTLGIAFSHSSGDSYALREPTSSDLAGLMTASLQFRGKLLDSRALRAWDADTVQVKLDGKSFPGDFDVLGASDRRRDIAVNWEVWYGERDLMDALERAREVEVVLSHTSTGTTTRHRFDVSSFKGMRGKLLAYWRCTAIPFRR